MKAILKRHILLALARADGVPYPDSALVQAVKLLARPLSPTAQDIATAIATVEAEGYVAGLTDPFTQERTWTLTAKGQHQAAQL